MLVISGIFLVVIWAMLAIGHLVSGARLHLTLLGGLVLLAVAVLRARNTATADDE